VCLRSASLRCLNLFPPVSVSAVAACFVDQDSCFKIKTSAAECRRNVHSPRAFTQISARGCPASWFLLASRTEDNLPPPLEEGLMKCPWTSPPPSLALLVGRFFTNLRVINFVFRITTRLIFKGSTYSLSNLPQESKGRIYRPCSFSCQSQLPFAPQF